MNVFTWSGRVFLWIFLTPIGLWRSIRHGRNKDVRRIEKAIREQGRNA